MPLEERALQQGKSVDNAESEIAHSIMIEDTRQIPDLTETERKKLLRKMDLRLVPMVTLLYLLSFLDRGNIGNARLGGLEDDLGLVGNQYNIALTIFFFPYCLFEAPSNLLLMRFRPSIWLPSIMIAWGTVMTLMGTVQNYEGLLATRFFLGMTESGLFPGVAYYLTMWYTRHEVQFRMGLFFAGASLAGGFSGLLAYAILKMDGVAGQAGWRWIFILEGILTVIVAVAAFWFIHDFPETAKFLTQRERVYLVHRLRHDLGGQGHDGEAVGLETSFRWKYVAMAFTDWQTYMMVLLYWAACCPLYGVSLFLPTIVKSMGYKSTEAQLLTIPIYAAACISCLLVGYLSDRLKKRAPFVFGCYVAMLTGYIMCAAPKHFTPGLTYAGIMIAACGLYSVIPGLLAWFSNNLAPVHKRSVAMALQIGLGTLAGAAASNFYVASDAPTYRTGHTIELAFVSMGLVLVVTYYISCSLANKKRAKMSLEAYTNQQLAELGDKSPAAS
ncbi:hypothetical protein AYL99_07759 [Fonsecaea erecta]|uniref:Major facilitator superfamily (MFS) profile domain-containing protein n=1 Tax=Fonsecaea erecta TaxID=1367422 RepID=A0A178ZFV2_9EURO|nr:hypothetical protein AYL99_07759 [Fonsecaea erecta]OAP58669.1 hypothetical protein AYL99_07759 [Fonsecaea erecta]